ncbi:hypothetical protein BKA70DRAFT_1289836 [Coprinopsis sp. MPI-PUGE-AT-0042]|nr:hypothetical protein BKA70DRAFT_1289836 [Coprinopsis sp. MPI-PUGE-AT-0042]
MVGNYLADSHTRIAIRSTEGALFLSSIGALRVSSLFRDMVEHVPCVPSEVPLPFRSEVLMEVIYWCEWHEGDAEPLDGAMEAGEWSSWDMDFTHRMDWRLLAEVLCAADYLLIDWLVAIVGSEMALRMQDRQPDELLAMFHMVSDLCPADAFKALKGVLPFLQVLEYSD